jgi:hypothetical protein
MNTKQVVIVLSAFVYSIDQIMPQNHAWWVNERLQIS